MARINFSDKEIANSIFQPKKEKQESTTTEDFDRVVYTAVGKQDEYLDGFPVVYDNEDKNGRIVKAEDNKFAYAKKDFNKYYIKGNSAGILDPFGLYDQDLYKKIGDQSIWRWRQVSPKIFNMYLLYLKTKNKSYYHNASRETF